MRSPSTHLGQEFNHIMLVPPSLNNGDPDPAVAAFGPSYRVRANILDSQGLASTIALDIVVEL